MSIGDIIFYIILLGVIAAIIAAVVHYGGDIHTASNVQADVNDTSALVAAVEKTYNGYSNYANLSDGDMISAQAVPTAITQASATSLQNVFGYPYTLAEDTTNPNAFDLTDEVPNDACSAIVNSVMKNITSLTVNGTAVTLPVTDPATIGQACGTTDPSTIVQVYSGM